MDEQQLDIGVEAEEWQNVVVRAPLLTAYAADVSSRTVQKRMAFFMLDGETEQVAALRRPSVQKAFQNANIEVAKLNSSRTHEDQPADVGSSHLAMKHQQRNYATAPAETDTTIEEDFRKGRALCSRAYLERTLVLNPLLVLNPGVKFMKDNYGMPNLPTKHSNPLQSVLQRMPTLLGAAYTHKSMRSGMHECGFFECDDMKLLSKVARHCKMFIDMPADKVASLAKNLKEITSVLKLFCSNCMYLYHVNGELFFNYSVKCES